MTTIAAIRAALAVQDAICPLRLRSYAAVTSAETWRFRRDLTVL
jgi:hypothetical protein